MFSSRKTGSASNNYLLTRSLRFRSSASAYLNRTPASSGNQQKFTISFWMKYSALTSDNILLSFGTSTTFLLQFVDGGRQLYIGTQQIGVGNPWGGSIPPLIRDPASWYHFVVAIDTTQATAANRVLAYINGVSYTFSGTAPTQNYNAIQNPTTTWRIGSRVDGVQYTDGYMAEINFIDGQALTPSSFGSTNAATGVWQPIKYTGTYGTNGFYLPFTNTTSTTTLGNDFSGNGNNWTTNNISLTSGSTYDSMKDVPTLTDTDTANYAVINPLQNGGLTITNGNLTWAASGSSVKCATGSIAMPSGKWYFEALITGSSGGNWYAGVCNLSPTLTSAPSATATGWGLVTGGGGTVLYKSNNNVLTSLSSSSVTGSVVSFAIDVDAGKIWFAQNGTWLEGSPSAGTGASYTNLTGTQVPYVAGYDSNDQGSINFGQRPFAYTPPTGFVALNTFNLPTPTIGATASSQANKYMDVSLYSGNGTSTGNTQVITNAGGFQPDFVWIKARNSSTPFHILNDSVRGTNKILYSNSTDVENSVSNVFNSFNSNGFTVDYNSSFSQTVTNQNGQTYVGWQWRASNATAVTNTAGSITSTVSANTTAGFSIVTYTGTGANATVGHGLGIDPKLIFIKRRNSTSDWSVYYNIDGFGAGVRYLLLNSTAAGTFDTTYWNSTVANTTVFSLGTNGNPNTNTGTYVAYCFAQVAGYSAFGSYVGNGNADGPFIYTGFRPRYYILKNITNAQSWSVQDTARSPYNVGSAVLLPNSSSAELTGTDFVDILSNGFKIRHSSSGNNNNSGDTYIYMAFAENPFKYANAR